MLFNQAAYMYMYMSMLFHTVHLLFDEKTPIANIHKVTALRTQFILEMV